MKKRLIYLLLVLLVLAQTAYLIHTFTCKKQGYHSDEIWSYGLANSYYKPFIIMKEGVSIEDIAPDNVINENQWLPGSIFHDYITVQQGERFAYGSVYHNQTLDHHPPLFYILLHTVCSFFPDQFSWWYGFSLCVLFFAGTQIFLFLAAKEMTGSEFTAWIACLFYGTGTGMLCTFAFVRQYSLLTMLSVAFTFLAFRLYRQEQREQKFYKKTMIALVIVSMLAFLTHYYAILYIGVYTAFYCLYLLLNRRIKQMFCFGGSLLGTLLIYFAIYPAALVQFFHTDTGYEKRYRMATQVRMLISHMFQYNFGFRTSYFATAFWNITLPLAAAFLVFGAMLLFPFRHEEWFGVFMGKVKESPRKIWDFLKNFYYAPVFVLAACFSIYVLVAKITDVVGNGVFEMRYITLTFPLICMLAVGAGYGVLKRIRLLRRFANPVLCAVVLGAVIYLRVFVPYPYVLWQYGDERSLQEMLGGKRVLVINASSKFNLITSTCFALYLSDTEECFWTAADCVRNYWQDVREGEEAVDVVIVDIKCLELTPEEDIKAQMWMGNAETKQEEPERVVDVTFAEGAQEEVEGKVDCTDLVEELRKEHPYELKKFFSVQGTVYYLLELSDGGAI